MDDNERNSVVTSEPRPRIRPSINAQIKVYHSNDTLYKLIESSSSIEKSPSSGPFEKTEIPTCSFRTVHREKSFENRPLSKTGTNYLRYLSPRNAQDYVQTNGNEMGIYYEVDEEDEQFICDMNLKHPDSHLDIYSFERLIEDLEYQEYLRYKQSYLQTTWNHIYNETLTVVDTLKSIVSSLDDSIPRPDSSLLNLLKKRDLFSPYELLISPSCLPLVPSSVPSPSKKKTTKKAPKRKTRSFSKKKTTAASVPARSLIPLPPPPPSAPVTDPMDRFNSIFLDFNDAKRILQSLSDWKVFLHNYYTFSLAFCRDFYQYWKSKCCRNKDLSTIYVPPFLSQFDAYEPYKYYYKPRPSCLPSLYVSPFISGGRRPILTNSTATAQLQQKLSVVREYRTRCGDLFVLAEQIRRREQLKCQLFAIYKKHCDLWKEHQFENISGVLLPYTYLPSLSVYRTDRVLASVKPSLRRKLKDSSSDASQTDSEESEEGNNS